MRRLAAPPSAAALAAAFAVALTAATAQAQVAADPKAQPSQSAPGELREEPAAPPEDDKSFSDRFVIETGRIAFPQLESKLLSLALHGEYQLRYRAMTDMRLQAPIGQPTVNRLGQNQYLYHWLRVGMRLHIFDKLALVGQIDVPRGLIVGDTTLAVDSVRDSYAAAKWYEVHPRYLYLEYNAPIGVFRAGQQGSHWGMGLLANDGDHPSMFGDYRRGALVERILFTTTPLGKDTPLFLALGGDLVFQDATANLLSGDQAFQGVAAIGWRTKHAEIGAYGVVRHQQRDARSVDQYTLFTESLTVGVVDIAGRFDAPLPGTSGDAFVYGQFEVAAINGATSFLRGAYNAPVDPTAPREKEKIRSFGGAAVLGATKVQGEGKERFGFVTGEIELGYASGDGDPGDGTSHRFTFDENHRVGLILFDHVMRWKTARAAYIAQDPAIVARAAPGIDLLPSRGGVFGAQYLNPRFVVRPKRFLDLKGGVVIAQTTADFVDPYHFGALGNARNYDNGNPRRHDLGIEIDAGAAIRIPVEPVSTIQIGAEGGVLFPGHAFDSASGGRLGNQFLANVQLGLQF